MVQPTGAGTADIAAADLARFGWLKLDDDLAHGPGELSADPRHAKAFLPFEALYTDGEAYYGSEVISHSNNDPKRQRPCRR